jgi:hypothetical protein
MPDVSNELVTFGHLLNNLYNLPNRFLNKSASASKPIYLKFWGKETVLPEKERFPFSTIVD